MSTPSSHTTAGSYQECAMCGPPDPETGHDTVEINGEVLCHECAYGLVERHGGSKDIVDRAIEADAANFVLAKPKTKTKTAFVITLERDLNGDTRSKWVEVGQVFENRDGTQTLKLDASKLGLLGNVDIQIR